MFFFDYQCISAILLTETCFDIKLLSLSVGKNVRVIKSQKVMGGEFETHSMQNYYSEEKNMNVIDPAVN